VGGLAGGSTALTPPSDRVSDAVLEPNCWAPAQQSEPGHVRCEDLCFAWSRLALAEDDTAMTVQLALNLGEEISDGDG